MMDSDLYNTKTKEELLDELANEDFQRKTISFYRYVKIDDVEEMRNILFSRFKELNCKGRIYVAEEGINAQMNVPEYNFELFDEFIQGLPEFKGVPYKLALEEKGNSSFLKLQVKVKDKIVADGLDDSSFDPSNTGKYMMADEVNMAIDDPEFKVIDMRNIYEAEIGHFEGANIMEVDTFRDQLERIEDDFREEKDKKILLYCTGGIRCEKASAWMKHLGFSNVYHIKGGIIDYARQVKEKGLRNRFLGKNFVFDGRMAEKVGDEVISKCHLCRKEKTDSYVNCKNDLCHMLFLGCEGCLRKKKGFCSYWCRLTNDLPLRIKKKLFARRIKDHGKQFHKRRFDFLNKGV